jgi:hypothetical protein
MTFRFIRAGAVSVVIDSDYRSIDETKRVLLKKSVFLEIPEI